MENIYVATVPSPSAVPVPLGTPTATRLGVTLDELRELIRTRREELRADPNRCKWCEEPFRTPGRRDRKWCSKDCHRLGNKHRDLL